jgi:hypothetical protein
MTPTNAARFFSERHPECSGTEAALFQLSLVLGLPDPVERALNFRGLESVRSQLRESFRQWEQSQIPRRLAVPVH